MPGWAGRIVAAAGFIVLFAAPVRAQHDLVLFAEPFAGGVQYLGSVGAGWGFGAALTAGPLHGVTLSEERTDDVRNWATSYAAVAYHPARQWRVQIAAGAALLGGDDFAAVYPSGQFGIEALGGRFRIGSFVRVIRIAGSNDTGDYWTQWVPLRLGYSLGGR